MESFGKSVRIYLVDGTVSGIKFGELVNNTIECVSCPRYRINELKNNVKAQRPGVYFLFGSDTETSNPMVYIGEAENVYDRLQNHIVNKDFWNEVIFFVSKDENLTKSHVKYLESRLIQIANSTRRYKVENSNHSQEASLPIADKAAMEEFLTFLRLLLGVFGHKLLEYLNETSRHEGVKTESINEQPLAILSNEFYLSVGGVDAKAIQTDEGMVVLKGSRAKLKCVNSLNQSCKDIREDLKKKGVIVEQGGMYIFNEDTLFSTPTQAASIITGYNYSGNNWFNKEKKSLKEVEEERLKL